MTAAVIPFPSRKHRMRPHPPAPELTLEQLRAAVEGVMARFPNLHAYGFGLEAPWRLSPEERARKLAAWRAELISDSGLDGVRRARAWLSRWPKTKRINTGAGTSYALKHIAAREIGYTTAGEFLVGAILAGFDLERDELGTGGNAFLNITSRCRASPA